MLKAFDEPSADQRLEKDEWGTTLSGYAPIRGIDGKAIAILGVDMDASDVHLAETIIREKSIVVLCIGVMFAMLLGLFISSRVVNPINKLRTGIEYINEGHLHHQVKVIGDDEIAQLARSFNEMASGLHDSRQKLLNYFYDAVKVLVMLLEARDHYTLGHSESVAHYSEKIALRLGMDPKGVEFFKRVVLLHDIGKVGVRDNVLLKTTKLDQNEWEVIRLHPVLGEQILKPILDDPIMLSVVRNHHERYDGKGYPDGWAKDQIPLLVAIVTVADSYDAMTSTRSYRQAMSKDQAIEQLISNRGTQFHPDVVDVFLTILREEDNNVSSA
jgi:HD-GYP domain-containing protein (c-di-GMP phosphodiesterase class II)